MFAKMHAASSVSFLIHLHPILPAPASCTYPILNHSGSNYLPYAKSLTDTYSSVCAHRTVRIEGSEDSDGRGTVVGDEDGEHGKFKPSCVVCCVS